MGQSDNRRSYQSRVHPDNFRHRPDLNDAQGDPLGLGSFGDLGPGDPALSEWQAAGLELPDVPSMRAHRLQRLRSKLAEHGCAAGLFYDPMNVRYATDSTNMQIWCLHNAVRYTLVFVDGPVLVWDFHGCEHLNTHLPLVDEVRNATAYYYFATGERSEETAARWATEVDEVLRLHMGSSKRIAVDKLELHGSKALEAKGWQLYDGQMVAEQARVIKGSEEIKALRCVTHATEVAMRHMQDALVPGISEQELWAVLHRENIARGGEWIETRLLASGPRTNPWFQECSSRRVEDGDIVAFDTDLVGAWGYMCDISRTWLAGDREATGEQRELYKMAREQIAYNLDVIRPGLSFLEYSQRAFVLPEDFQANHYSVITHGVGQCDEYPSIYYPTDVAAVGYDGMIEPGMCLTVESLIGKVGGRECVKLEEQLMVTETGVEVMSRYPFEDARFGL